MTLVPVRARILACQEIPQVDEALARAWGIDLKAHTSLGLITADQDDSLYAALDDATKAAEVEVVFAKSFYAGSAHASGPFSGEILGVLGGRHPDDVAEGLWAARAALTERVCFYHLEGYAAPTFFPHVIAETGRYLAPLAGIRPGEPLAYLIAPPMEAMIAVDAALKAAPVRLCKLFPPPTETNFAGAYLTGSVADVEAAAAAFVEAIGTVVRAPLAGLRRPARERY